MTTINIFQNPNQCHTYSADDVIINEGDAGDCMYDVISGTVALFRNGKELVRLGEGEIFGETGLINNEAHSVQAVAMTDCEVAAISKQQFLFMVDETPNFAIKVMSVLAQRLSQETAKHL